MSRLRRPWLVAGVLLAAAAAHASPPAGAETAPAYLMLVDHSGSMVEHPPGGPPHWITMKERARRFLSDVPEGAEVWFALFSDRVSVQAFDIRTDADREKATLYLRDHYKRPTGGTRLFDAVGAALDHAGAVERATPGRVVHVMVYTDGKDTASRAWCAGSSKDEPTCAGRRPRRSLCHRLHQIVSRQERVTIFVTRIGGGLPIVSEACGRGIVVASEPKYPIPVMVAPDRLTLESPRSRATQEAALDLFVAPRALKRTGPFDVGLSFAPGDGLGPVAVTPASIRVTSGRMRVPIRLTVQQAARLAVEREYSGRLILSYPARSKEVFQGRHDVPVRFEKSGLEIFGVTPSKDNRVFAVGQPVQFQVRTLDRAKVAWRATPSTGGTPDFEATGPEHVHPFATPGKHRVTVTASLDSLQRTQTLDIEVIDAALDLVVPPGLLYAGRKATFAVRTGDTGYTGFSWAVDGRQVPGGKTAEIVLPRPGRIQVRVVGAHSRLPPVQVSRELDVQPGPTVALQVVDLSDGAPNKAEYYYGRKLRLDARVTGPIRAVSWTVTPRHGKPFTLDPVPVVDGKASRSLAFDEAARMEGAAVRAQAALDGGGQLASAPLEFRLLAEPRGLRFVAPTANRLPYGKVRLEVRVAGGDIDQVRWSTRPPLKAPIPSSPVVAGKATADLVVRESDGLSGITVEAVGHVPAGFGAPAPASIALTFLSAERSVSITAPGAGSILRFGQEVRLTAAITGAGVRAVRWTAGLAGSPPATQVAPVDGGHAAWTFRVPASATDATLTATAVLELEPGIRAAAPSASATWKVAHPELSVAIVTEAQATWRKPHAFALTCTPACEDATWTFGDEGDRTSGLTPSHAFDQYGTFQVKVTAHAACGKTASHTADVTVIPHTPAADLHVQRAGTPALRVPVGEPVELRNTSTGDVAEILWEVDGTPQAAKGSAVFRTCGPHSVRLSVVGPAPDRSRDSKSIDVHAFQTYPTLGWGLLALTTVLVAFLGVLLLGNRPVRWSIVALDASVSAEAPDVLERGESTRLWRLWKRWPWRWLPPSKRLRVPVKVLDLPANDPRYASWVDSDLTLVVERHPKKRRRGHIALEDAGEHEDTSFERVTAGDRLYRLEDRRARQERPYPALYLMLDDDGRGSGKGRERLRNDLWLLAISAVLAGALVWCAFEVLVFGRYDWLCGG